jgi:hypothetical protein
VSLSVPLGSTFEIKAETSVMAATLKDVFDRVKRELELPANVAGFQINRKKIVRPLGLVGYLGA